MSKLNGGDKNPKNCPMTHAMNIIGGKWRLPIIWALHKNGIMRYNVLNREVEGITNMMLTQSLRELEEAGIITRTQYMEIPPRVEYALSDEGDALIPALKALASWGQSHMDAKKNKDQRHR